MPLSIPSFRPFRSPSADPPTRPYQIHTQTQSHSLSQSQSPIDMTGSFALSRSLSEADIAPVAKAKALETKADNALSFTRHAIIDHFRPHRPSVITDLDGPHPLEPGLQPLSPSLLRAALTLPVRTAVSVSVSVEQPNSPKTPTLVQNSDPESPSSPETPAGEIHFAFPSSFVAAEVPPPRINISKAFPKMTSNGLPSGPTLRAKVCRCTAFTRSQATLLSSPRPDSSALFRC